MLRGSRGSSMRRQRTSERHLVPGTKYSIFRRHNALPRGRTANR